MGAAQIDMLARIAKANLPDAPGDVPPHRRRKNLDDAVFQLYRQLRSTIRVYSTKKGLANFQQEADQHGYIAIFRAIESWDDNIASFNTHVNWLIRGEMADAGHKLLPEQRKIKTPVPVRVVSFDAPVKGNEDNDDFHGFIADERSHAEIENTVWNFTCYRILDRIFSDIIGRRLEILAERKKVTEDILDKEVRQFMRDRDMYLRHMRDEETLDTIGQHYGVSRERVRQISTDMGDRVNQAYFGTYKEGSKKKYRRQPIPTDFHPCWDACILTFHAMTGKDARLTETDLVLPTHRAPIEGAVQDAGLTPEYNEDTVPATVETVRIETPAQDVVRRAEDDRTRGLPLFRAMLASAALAATAMAGAANAQTSRAIPPEDSAVVQQAPTHSVRAHRAQTRAFTPVEVGSIATKRPVWAVAVAQYGTQKELMGQWNQQRDSWSMLKGLMPAYAQVDADKGKAYRLVFGPLDQAQAEGVCHEAKRGQRPCAVTTFGHVPAAKGVPDGHAAA